MSNIKPTRAQMFNGLRRRPQYEEISNEINPDKTKIIYPNRDAKFLREDPRMTQLDGLGFFESMQEQQEAINKEQRKGTIMQEIARDSNTGVKEVKAKDPPKKPEVFNMASGDDDDGDAPMPGHEQAIAEATETSKTKKMTKAQKAIFKAKLVLRKTKNKTNELVEKNNPEIPDEKMENFDPEEPKPPPKTKAKKTQKEILKAKLILRKTKNKTNEIVNPEIPDEIIENDTDKPKPPPKMRKVKMDTGITKKTKAKKTKPEIKKEEIKEEVKEELKEVNPEPEPKRKGRGRSKSVPKERSRSRDAKSEPKSETKSETKSEPRSRSRSRSKSVRVETSEPEIKIEPASPPKARGRPKSASSKRDYVEVVKDEVENIEQRKPRARTRSVTRTPKKESPKKETPKKESPKKEEDNEPESRPEPKGKPGRPRSVMAKPVEPSSSSSSSSKPRVASTAPKSKAKESFEVTKPAPKDEMTQVTSLFALGKSTKEKLINQLELRGFQGKRLTEIKRMNKPEILELIGKLIDEDKWV